jgi:small-conductance mechanosensitive channel
MLAAVDDDPRILPSPPARVFLAKLGNASLEFELIAVVTSVETVPAVRSDLQLRLLRNFRDKGIRVAAQLPAAPPPVVVSLDEALGAVAAAKLRGGAKGEDKA